MSAGTGLRQTQDSPAALRAWWSFRRRLKARTWRCRLLGHRYEASANSTMFGCWERCRCGDNRTPFQDSWLHTTDESLEDLARKMTLLAGKPGTRLPAPESWPIGKS